MSVGNGITLKSWNCTLREVDIGDEYIGAQGVYQVNWDLTSGYPPYLMAFKVESTGDFNNIGYRYDSDGQGHAYDDDVGIVYHQGDGHTVITINLYTDEDAGVIAELDYKIILYASPAYPDAGGLEPDPEPGGSEPGTGGSDTPTPEPDEEPAVEEPASP